jgi:hypothetical protein
MVTTLRNEQPVSGKRETEVKEHRAKGKGELEEKEE